MSRKSHLAILLAALFGVLIGLNLLAASFLSGVRLDTTQSGLYRLSDGTRSVVESLEEPVRWTFYYSRRTAADYPAIRAYGSRVRGLLQSYADLSNGRILLTEVDPEPFSEVEDAALEAGLIPTPAGEGDRIFFGLVAENSVDDRQVLASFSAEREALLEYDLTRSLADLSRDQRGRLGILTSLPIEPGAFGARPSHIVDELTSAYDLEWLSAGFIDLPDVEALLIIHPPRLSEDQLYLIDQFVLSGGRLILALDPLALAAFRSGSDGLPPPNARRSSTLEALLPAWGATVSAYEVVMDRDLGLPVQITEDGRNQIRSYPLWFSVGPPQFSRDDLATSGLQRGVNFGSPGHIQLSAVDGLGVRILARTSASGAIIDTDLAANNPSPAALLNDYEAAASRPVLAVRLSGLFPSAFGASPPQINSGHLTRSRSMGDVVIIADADWLDDPYFLRQDASLGLSIVADNPAFLLNLVDLALGDPALLALRSLPSSARPMERIERLRSEAEAAYADEQAALEDRAAGIQAQLDMLMSGRPQEGAPLTRETLQARINSLEAEMASARDGLRDIERAFRETIDGLEASLRFWTLWLPPILILLIGVGVGILRQRKTLS